MESREPGLSASSILLQIPTNGEDKKICIYPGAVKLRIVEGQVRRKMVTAERIIADHWWDWDSYLQGSNVNSCAKKIVGYIWRKKVQVSDLKKKKRGKTDCAWLNKISLRLQVKSNVQSLIMLTWDSSVYALLMKSSFIFFNYWRKKLSFCDIYMWTENRRKNFWGWDNGAWSTSESLFLFSFQVITHWLKISSFSWKNILKRK